MWKLRVIFAVGAFGLFGYAAYVVPKLPPNPPVPRSFQQHIRSNKPNPRGDREWLCETAYCNPDDRYIGLKTHLLYQGLKNVSRGVAIREIGLWRVDSKGNIRPDK